MPKRVKRKSTPRKSGRKRSKSPKRVRRVYRKSTPKRRTPKRRTPKRRTPKRRTPKKSKIKIVVKSPPPLPYRNSCISDIDCLEGYKCVNGLCRLDTEFKKVSEKISQAVQAGKPLGQAISENIFKKTAEKASQAVASGKTVEQAVKESVKVEIPKAPPLEVKAAEVAAKSAQAAKTSGATPKQVEEAGVSGWGTWALGGLSSVAKGVGYGLGYGAKGLGYGLGYGAKGLGYGVKSIGYGAKGLASGLASGLGISFSPPSIEDVTYGVGRGLGYGVKGLGYGVGYGLGYGTKGIGKGLYYGGKGIGKGLYYGGKGIGKGLYYGATGLASTPSKFKAYRRRKRGIPESSPGSILVNPNYEPPARRPRSPDPIVAGVQERVEELEELARLKRELGIL